MTNALSPEAVGQVALLLILGELLGTCCNLGLTAALPKLLPACDESGRNRLLGALIPFQFVAAVLMALLTTLIAPYGARLAHRLDKRVLRRAFAVYLLVTAALVVIKAL